MKKIILLSVCILYCLFSYSQTPQLSNVINITLPDSAEKLGNNAIQSLNNDFKRNQIPSGKNIYRIKKVILSFWDLSVSKTNKKDLKASRSELAELLHRNKAISIDRAEVVLINNINFLILKYHENDEFFLRFYSDYKNNKNVSGLIQYKQDDEADAAGVFNKVIKSITFK